MKLQTARSEKPDLAVIDIAVVSLPKLRSYPWISATYSSAGALMSSRHFAQRMYPIWLIMKFSRCRWCLMTTPRLYPKIIFLVRDWLYY